ncbi:GxxExxY protein [Sorangium atrum]|uniref:GxxExxY protein n=1 Tax=Sorangium atrum TaxID=2995308 RepID=A0ABT5C941_9BACT|nr:GxxExxY protein [Sorangium aterium]MDC0682887.1 GxxExxY protein [Sorangium aterium]
MTENEIAKVVVDAAIEVHRTLGAPGLLETVYEEVLAFELKSRGLTVVRQKAVPLVYKGKRLASDLRLDLFVGDRVIVESSSSARRRPPTTRAAPRGRKRRAAALFSCRTRDLGWFAEADGRRALLAPAPRRPRRRRTGWPVDGAPQRRQGV